ncbi:GNAT family N-acetyltransferase [Haladaptatus sp. NG-SE-30]
MPEYRKIPEDEDAFRRFLQYAFRPEVGPELDDDDDKPELGDRRGLCEGDDLLCVCKHHWFTARLRGDWHDVAGLSAVASPPESRRKGLVTRMLLESLSEYRENDVSFSALWPFAYEFYRKYGWATVTKYTKYETTPDALELDIEPKGEFRRLDADDWELLEPVLAAHGEQYALTLDRTEEWWRHRVFEGWQKDPFVYGWFADGTDAISSVNEMGGSSTGAETGDSSNVNVDDSRAEELLGYVTYSIDEDGDDRQLRVREFVYVDHEAYRQLLRFVQYHDSQVDSVRFYESETENSSLLDVVDDPRAVDCEIHTGPMFRLVDVSRALERLSYPDDADGRIVFQVTDPLAEWNEGTFELDVGETVRCERTDTDPDVTTDVNTLSQLVAGYYSVEDAERFGDFVVETANTREQLATCFPERDVFLREGF